MVLFSSLIAAEKLLDPFIFDHNIDAFIHQSSLTHLAVICLDFIVPKTSV